MIDFLVGCTGFVGFNLAAAHKFSGLYHSSDISGAYGKKPDLLVYAGVRSEMFLANSEPLKDKEMTDAAKENILRINPRRLVLVSTAAVYPDARGVDEDTEIDAASLRPYGANRYDLELWAENNIDECCIVRLPALYGKNLRKNFLYDYIHVIPLMLSGTKFHEFLEHAPCLSGFYELQDNGYFKCRGLTSEESSFLKNIFRELGFTALNFTDSRSVYQFYALKDLWHHIKIVTAEGIRKVNLVPPPLQVSELYSFLSGRSFSNILNGPAYYYDIRTKYDSIFGGSGGYITSKEHELESIREFVKQEGA